MQEILGFAAGTWQSLTQCLQIVVSACLVSRQSVAHSADHSQAYRALACAVILIQRHCILHSMAAARCAPLTCEKAICYMGKLQHGAHLKLWLP